MSVVVGYESHDQATLPLQKSYFEFPMEQRGFILSFLLYPLHKIFWTIANRKVCQLTFQWYFLKISVTFFLKFFTDFLENYFTDIALKFSLGNPWKHKPENVQINLKKKLKFLLYPYTRPVHVYLNWCEFHFLRLDVNKTNKFYFLINNGRVPGMVK